MGVRANKGALHFDLDAMTTAFPLSDVQRALEQSSRMGKRTRKLPSPTMVYLVIALGLMVSAGAKKVLRRLLDHAPNLDWTSGVPLVSEAAICKARKRIGFEPLQNLFNQEARPIALRRTRGAWFRGRRVVTLDGSTLQVHDSIANERAFGRPATAKRPAAWPIIRFVLLIENGTRACFGAAMDRWSTSENVLAREVIGRLSKGMLCLADRLFYSYAMWTQAVATGADLLWRVPKNITLPRLKVFRDRSYLSEIRPPKGGSSKQRAGGPIAVRVVEFTLTINDRVEHYRLITTLLNPREATAFELARLYAQRWEIETALREIKAQLRGQRVLLRSRIPELVKTGFLRPAAGLLRGAMPHA